MVTTALKVSALVALPFLVMFAYLVFMLMTPEQEPKPTGIPGNIGTNTGREAAGVATELLSITK